MLGRMRTRRLWTTLLVGLVVLGLAKLHACACTGGRPTWTSVLEERGGR